jgi:hypothetical protein
VTKCTQKMLFQKKQFFRDFCFSGITFFRSLHFWNLCKKTDLLIPVMTHFEKKKNFHPQFSPESADRKTLDGLQRTETHFFLFFVFWNIIFVCVKLWFCSVIFILSQLMLVIVQLFECECVPEIYYLFVLLYDVLKRDNRKGRGPQTERRDWMGRAYKQCNHSIMRRASPLM